jgi:cellobiose-specific phosphotransferase system component IIA
MMNLKNTVVAVMVGAMIVFGTGVTQAAETIDHKAEALKHIQAGIEEGKQGKADTLVEHAKEAMNHISDSMGQSTSPQLQNAAKQVREAINQGKEGKADTATKSLEEANKALSTALPKYKDSPF